MIQLKRFRYTAKGYVNDNSKVLLPRNVFKLGNERYQLKGMVNHCGPMSSGHYTACIRHHEDWVKCDDAKINTMSQLEWNSKLAYILFLELIPCT